MYIICYDIADGRRLYRVARLLEDYGIRVQKSVFYCNPSESNYQRLFTFLNRIIDAEEDKILIQPICTGCEKKMICIGKESESLQPVMENYRII